jgi:hypothetical protein
MTKMMMYAPTAPPMTRSDAAERMRAHRERRRQGLRCLMIELCETDRRVDPQGIAKTGDA